MFVGLFQRMNSLPSRSIIEVKFEKHFAGAGGGVFHPDPHKVGSKKIEPKELGRFSNLSD